MTSEAAPLAPWIVNSLMGLITLLVGGVGAAVVRKHNASAKQAEAAAAEGAGDAAASGTLWTHYRAELEDLRREVRAIGERLATTEAELAKVEEAHKYAVAGERRYREAFAELLMIYTDFVAAARNVVSAEITRLADQRLSVLVMALARPIYAEKETEDGKSKD